MTETVNNIAGVALDQNINSVQKNPENSKGQESFFNMLQDALKDVNQKQVEADEKTEKFVAGETDNLHDLMIKTQEARLSLQFTTQVTNKIVESYRELSQMQI